MEHTFLRAWGSVLITHANKRALSDSKRVYTFAQINQKARALSEVLRTKNILRKCVLIRMQDPLESIIAMIGVLLSGNYYFYLNKDAYLRIGSLLRFLEVGTSIFESNEGSVYSKDDIDWSNLQDAQDSFEIDHNIKGEDFFAVFTTSGTTGSPKLVRHTHQFIIQDTQSQVREFTIDENDRRDYAGSLMFSASLGAIFPTLLAGAELVIHSTATDNVFALPLFWQKNRITLTTVPVNVLRVLAKSDRSLRELAHLRIIIVSAEAASRADMELFLRSLPPNIVLANGYATTETRGISLAKFQLSNFDEKIIGTVGIPVPGRKIRIADNDGNELKTGEIGEIVVGNKFFPDGYLNIPNESQQCFEKEEDGTIYFRTGDLGYLNPDGYLSLTGRKDFIVKINGIKVNLSETESCLAAYSKVKEVVVCQKSNQLIHCFLSVREDFSIEELKLYAKEHLQPINLPAGWTILNELPKTITGKFDRRQLQERLSSVAQTEEEPTEEQSTTLSTILTIWKKELQLTQNVLPDQEFFNDLNGNSLLCAVCLHSLEEQLGFSLPINTGYTYTTAASLSDFISKYRNQSVLKITLIPPTPGKPNLYLIPPYPGDRRTYHTLEERLSPHYNLHFLYYNPINPDQSIVHFNLLITLLADEIESGTDTHLLGFSFGGIIGYFLTLELEKRNQKVSQLILLDTPTYIQYSRTEKLFNFSVRLARKIRQLPRAPLAITKKYLINFSETYREYRSNFTPEKAKTDANQPSKIIWNYVLQFPPHRKTNADILLFRVSESGMGYQFKPDYAWNNFTTRSLKLVGLSGWHEEVFNLPSNIEVILDTLTAETRTQV